MKADVLAVQYKVPSLGLVKAKRLRSTSMTIRHQGLARHSTCIRDSLGRVGYSCALTFDMSGSRRRRGLGPE